MNIKILCLIFFLQIYSADAQTLLNDHFGPEQGLSQNSIRCLLQDKKGKMWIGTNDGLNHFDGYDFVHVKNEPFNPYSLSSDIINCIFQDKYDRIWVGTEHGLDVLNDQGKWLFKIPLLSDEKKYITQIIGLNENEIAVSTLKNLYIIHVDFNFNNKVAEVSHKIEGKIRTLVHDMKGGLWIASTEGVFKCNITPEGFQVAKKIKNEHVSALIPWQMAIDAHDNIWVIASGRLLFVDTKSDSIHLSEYVSGDITLTSIFIDQAGEIWIGSLENGIKTYSIKTNGQLIPSENVHPENANLYLANTMIMCMYESSYRNEDIVWIGTGEKGLYKYSRSKNVFRHHENYFFNITQTASVYYSILKEKNYLWTGTSKGLFRQNLSSNAVEKIKTPTTYNQEAAFYCIFKDRRGKIWAGTDQGLFYFDKKSNSIFIHELPVSAYQNLKILKITEDKKGTIWLCTNKGLFALEDRLHFRDYTSVLKPLFIGSKNMIINDIIEDNENSYWVATSEGLILLKGNHTNIFRHKVSEPQGILDNLVIDVFCDSHGQVWLGTSKGLSKISVQGQGYCFDHFTEKDGLSNSFIYSIQESNDKNLWISCNHGLIRFEPLSYNIKTFRAEDGLIREEFNSGAATKDENGHLYFGGLGILVSFNPEKIKPNIHATGLILKSIRIMDNETNIYSISDTSPLIIGYGEKYIRLKLSAIDYTNSIKNQYAYKIKGIHNDWIQNENERVISLLNLPSGKHTMEIMAANSDGVWNYEGSLSIPMIVGTPFWKQNWFLIISGFIIAGFGYVYFRSHVRKKLMIEKIRLEENERVRKIAAQDMHDDFGNTLTRIGILSKMASNKLDQDKTPEAKILLDKISENSYRLYQGTKDFIWALNPESDNLWETMVRIKDFAEDATSSSGLNFNATGINEYLKNCNLRPGTNRHVVMIMKEAITNTLKHAEATNAELSVIYDNVNLEINWTDNGKGTTGDLKTGNGITNMKTRAMKNGGSLYISKPEKGTKIQLKLNLPKYESKYF